MNTLKSLFLVQLLGCTSYLD